MKNLHSELSEQAILGLLLLDNKSFRLVEGKIEAEDFYIPLHSKIFKAISDILKQSGTAWPGSVIPLVADESHSLEEVSDYLKKIFYSAELGGNVLACANTIADFTFKRRLIDYAKALNVAVEKGDEKTSQDIQRKISELASSHISILPDDPIEQLQAAFNLATNPEPMIPSGIASWDETFGGLAKGVRYIIAGRAGSGKTALALNIAWNTAKIGFKARYVFFEGRNEEIWHRIMSREMKLPITSFRKGLTPYQQGLVLQKQDMVRGYDFAVVRDPRNVNEMITRCGACDVIVVDGISSAPAPGADGLIERVTMITAYCKTLADKTGAAVIMLAHLNSDGIKQAGTGTGIFGGQSATFDPESIVELRADEDTKGQKVRMVEGIVTKNRYGELKTMRFIFEGEYMTYGS